MSGKLVDLSEVLSVLGDEGPMSSREFAARLTLHELDARLALTQAHALGLLSTNSRGEWTLTADGRSAVAAGQRPTPESSPRSRRRYASRPALTVAVGSLLAAASVAVARNGSGLLLGGPSGPDNRPRIAAHGHHHRLHHHVRIRSRFAYAALGHRHHSVRSATFLAFAVGHHTSLKHHHHVKHQTSGGHVHTGHRGSRPARKSRHH